MENTPPHGEPGREPAPLLTQFRNVGEAPPKCARCKVADLIGYVTTDAQPAVPAIDPICNALGEVLIPGFAGYPERPAIQSFFSPWCDACVTEIKLEAKKAETAGANKGREALLLESWLEQWEGGPRSLYHQTDFAKFPNKKASEQVLDWEPTNSATPGLLLIGSTGRAKTRTVYLLLKALWLQGVKAAIWPCVKLRHAVATAARSRDETAREKFMERIFRSPILFLDDLGKMNDTPSSTEALFEIIEGCTIRGIPIIATSQIGGKEFVALFDSEAHGTAMSRRLEQFCEIIKF